MTDPRVAKLAQVIIDYSVAVREGDRVFLRADAGAAPLVRELYRRALARGAHVVPDIQLPGMEEIFFRTAGDAQLQYVSPVLQHVVENFEVRLSVSGESNTRELSAIDPARQVMRQQAYSGIFKTFLDRAARGELRWNTTLYPTDAYAMEADMALADYEDFVYAACLVDQEDPIAAWKEVKRRQQTLVDGLAGKREVHVQGPGTDLTVCIEGRPFINCFGDYNMPDGEIFTGPVEDSVNGTIRFSFPAIYGGREIEDVRLWFENGVIVRATAAKNEEYLNKVLDTDQGSRRAGEFAFGTNFGIQRFVKNMLFDEKIGGTLHMAMGLGYPESGSKNESGIHWDMLCDLRQGSEIRVDGELFAKDGKYVLWQ